MPPPLLLAAQLRYVRLLCLFSPALRTTLRLPPRALYMSCHRMAHSQACHDHTTLSPRFGKAVSTLSLSPVQASLTLPPSPSPRVTRYSTAARIKTTPACSRQSPSFAALFPCRSQSEERPMFNCSHGVISQGPGNLYRICWHIVPSFGGRCLGLH